MAADHFISFLIGQIPYYDEAIIKDIRPSASWIGKPKPGLDHLAEDFRFLPKRLASVYLMRIEHPKMKKGWIARKLNIKKKTVESRLDRAWDIVDSSLKAWLKTLPKLERRREIYKRHKTCRKRRSERGSFPKEAMDRFRGVWPNATSSNLKSDFPPSRAPKSSQQN